MMPTSFERSLVPGLAVIVGLCAVGAVTLIGAGLWEMIRLAKWMLD